MCCSMKRTYTHTDGLICRRESSQYNPKLSDLRRQQIPYRHAEFGEQVQTRTVGWNGGKVADFSQGQFGTIE